MVVGLFLFLLVPCYGVESAEKCKTSKCSSHGPPVRFPFRIKGRQPQHCGYPEVEFDLSCSDNETVLELSTSWKLFIHKIDYESQVIYANDSEGCLPIWFYDLYDFNYRYLTINFTLFNCSSKKQRVSSTIPRLRDQVYATTSEDSIAVADLVNCTKMYDISAVAGDYLSYSVYNNLGYSACEVEGECCRLKINPTPSETEDYGEPIPTQVMSSTQRMSAGALKKYIEIGITLRSLVPIVVLIALFLIFTYNKAEREFQSKIEKFLDDYKSFKPSRYSYADIKRITNHFKDELGKGAYGTVYRGKLSDQILVAVKVLNISNGNGEEFVNEVGTIGRIHHVNVVRLIGFCAEGFRRALVYEYLPNDTLNKFISSAGLKNHFLGWKRQKGIALGIAEGIEYLHQGCDQRILHFDIKPQNILLDQDFNPKVADFGLAKLCAKDQSAVSVTTARGTIGYIAPEVFSRNFGKVSYKSDIYSFGMLVLEMVGGRKIVEETEENEEQIYFPEWIYNLLEEGEDLRLEIEEEEDAKIAKKLAIVGLWCIQWNPADRPSMKTVIHMLEAETENLQIPPNPFGSANSSRMKARVRPSRRLRWELEAISETE